MSRTENDLYERRKRLKFRAWHRGTKEGDLIIGHFVEQNLDRLDHDLCAWFEALLEEQEQEVLEWITGKSPLPEKYDTPLMAELMKLEHLPRDGSDG